MGSGHISKVQAVPIEFVGFQHAIYSLYEVRVEHSSKAC